MPYLLRDLTVDRPDHVWCRTLHALIDCVEVGDVDVRLNGPIVEHARLTSSPAELAPIFVPNFAGEWRATDDEDGHWEITTPLLSRSSNSR